MKKTITVAWVPIPREKQDLGLFHKSKELRVRESDHPKFPVDSHFDVKFIEMVSADDYTVNVLPK